MDQADARERREEGQREVLFKHYHEYKVAFMSQHGRHCQHCGVEMTHTVTDGQKRKVASIDHIVPKALGGSDMESNLTVCCCSCNTSKGKSELDDFRQRRGSQIRPVISLQGLWSDDFDAKRLSRVREKWKGKSVISVDVDRGAFLSLRRRAKREGRSLQGLVRWLALQEARKLGVTKDGTEPTV